MDRGSSPDRAVPKLQRPKAEAPKLAWPALVGFTLLSAGLVGWIITGNWRYAAIGAVLLLLGIVIGVAVD